MCWRACVCVCVCVCEIGHRESRIVNSNSGWFTRGLIPKRWLSCWAMYYVSAVWVCLFYRYGRNKALAQIILNREFRLDNSTWDRITEATFHAEICLMSDYITCVRACVCVRVCVCVRACVWCALLCCVVYVLVITYYACIYSRLRTQHTRNTGRGGILYMALCRILWESYHLYSQPVFFTESFYTSQLSWQPLVTNNDRSSCRS